MNPYEYRYAFTSVSMAGSLLRTALGSKRTPMRAMRKCKGRTNMGQSSAIFIGSWPGSWRSRKTWGSWLSGSCVGCGNGTDAAEADRRSWGACRVYHMHWQVSSTTSTAMLFPGIAASVLPVPCVLFCASLRSASLATIHKRPALWEQSTNR